MFASSGILFNHESPRRGENFVSRKVTRGVAQILSGREEKLKLGNLEARRDWGDARDYVRAMWLMLQQDEPDDFVIATGEHRTVRELVATAFEMVGLDWQKYVLIDQAYIRPSEVDDLQGDSTKARKRFGWEPTIGFEQMIREMLESDLALEGLDPKAHLQARPATSA